METLLSQDTVYFTTHNHATGAITVASSRISSGEDSTAVSSSMVCLRSIPSFMLPKELLYFLTGYLSNISSITILKELTKSTTAMPPAVGDYLALISFMDASTIPHFLSDFYGRPLSTLQPTSADFSLVQCPLPLSPINVSDASCPVCLEPLSNQQYSFFCGHSFHFACVQKLETERCPVCRYEHEEMSEGVCCEVCQENSINSNSSGDSNMWICLVCGFCGCGSSSSNHSREHYLATLHAYAINSSSRRVWDYAGEGYVHRLILSNSSGAGKITAVLLYDFILPHGSKIVEVTNPRHMSEMRPVVAPLTSQQEEQLLSRKLEDTAKHYSGVFAWQLEQQREYYEGQLASLQSIIDEANSAAEIVVTADILKSLEKERHKLAKQCDAARARLRTAQEESSLLLTLNQSLESGAGEWQRAVAVAEKELEEEEALYRTEIPKLEKKVRRLMAQLDRSCESNECYIESKTKEST